MKMITKEQYESKKNMLETLCNAAENVTNRIERNCNLTLIDLPERNRQINNYFAETDNLSFDVWEYEFYQAKKAYKNSLKKFIRFVQKDKLDGMIAIISATPIKSKKIDYKKVDTLEKLLIESCEQDYKELVQAAKGIPSVKYSEFNFPVKPIDLEQKFED